MGVVIGFAIIKASIEMINETIDTIVGVRIDSNLSKNIKSTINEFPEVYGVYDLRLHTYGPSNMQGSVHVEVDDYLTATEIQNLSRQISLKIYDEFSIVLTVGIYARNHSHLHIKKELERISSEYEEVLDIHGFMVYEDKDLITLDMIIDFDANREKIKDEILSKIKEKYPKFNYVIIDDYDISD